MEVYLNIIETGNGIYGAQATAATFFKKNASTLTKGEAARIAAVLPNPRKLSIQKPSRYVLKRQDWIINQMAHWGGSLKYDEVESTKK